MASDIDIAVDKTARNFKNEKGERGFTALAESLGQNPRYFSNKVSAGYDDAHLNPNELLAVMNQADNYELLHTYARLCRRPQVCVELGEYSDVSDVALLDAWLNLQIDQGQTADAIKKAIAKGDITRKAFNEIDREMHEDITCMFELRARLEGLVR